MFSLIAGTSEYSALGVLFMHILMGMGLLCVCIALCVPYDIFQYTNAGNPVAHYDTTAEEIIKQCGGL